MDLPVFAPHGPDGQADAAQVLDIVRSCLANPNRAVDLHSTAPTLWRPAVKGAYCGWWRPLILRSRAEMDHEETCLMGSIGMFSPRSH